jgi:hypothetical protein
MISSKIDSSMEYIGVKVDDLQQALGDWTLTTYDNNEVIDFKKTDQSNSWTLSIQTAPSPVPSGSLVDLAQKYVNNFIAIWKNLAIEPQSVYHLTIDSKDAIATTWTTNDNTSNEKMMQVITIASGTIFKIYYIARPPAAFPNYLETIKNTLTSSLKFDSATSSDHRSPQVQIDAREQDIQQPQQQQNLSNSMSRLAPQFNLFNQQLQQMNDRIEDFQSSAQPGTTTLPQRQKLVSDLQQIANQPLPVPQEPTDDPAVREHEQDLEARKREVQQILDEMQRAKEHESQMMEAKSRIQQMQSQTMMSIIDNMRV